MLLTPEFLILGNIPILSLLLITSLGSLTTVATDIFFCEVCTEFLVKEIPPPFSCLSGALCQSSLCAPSSLLDHKGLGHGYLMDFPIDLLSCWEPHLHQWEYLEMLSGKFLKQMWHPQCKDILLGAWNLSYCACEVILSLLGSLFSGHHRRSSSDWRWLKPLSS